MALLAATHRLAGPKPIELSALANDGFLLFPRELAPRLHDVLISHCRHAGFEPSIRSESFHTGWELPLAKIAGRRSDPTPRRRRRFRLRALSYDRLLVPGPLWLTWHQEPDTAAWTRPPDWILWRRGVPLWEWVAPGLHVGLVAASHLLRIVVA